MDKWEQILLRAKNDLITARKGLIEPKTLDTSAYHCQQCAEKSLKAYLNYRGVDTEERGLRTQNLLILLKACVNQDEEFQKIKSACGILNPNDTLYRYFNNNQVMPEEEEVVELIQLAEEVYEFVVKLVS